MKKYLLAVLLLASFQSFGQFLNYTNINGRYKWIAGKFDSTFTIPSGTTPSLRVGGGTGPGALFYRTTDSTVYQYTGTQWIKLRAGVSPTDTAGIWISNVYRQTGTDSVFYVKGGTSTFAFRDSIGNVGGGGGGGKIYYFNGGVNLGTFAGLTMYELGDTAVTSAAANFTRSTTGNLANFITDVNRPGLLQIPAGVWTVDAYLSETGGGSNHAQIWIEVEKWNGSTITTIATSPIEEITNGNVIDLYTWGVSIPTTTLAVTDRIIIQFYITNTNGKTVTLYTQNGYVGEVHTTFTTGIGSLNGLTAPTQYFATGTSGTDFGISSSTATHTFNLPTASGSNRGALSSTDWTTFNSKVGGSGTTNYVSKFTGSGTIGNSQIFDNGTNVGINTTSPSSIGSDVTTLDIVGRSVGWTGGVYLNSSNNSVRGYFYGESGGFYIGSGTSNPLIFRTSATERMRLTAAGRLLLGTSTESTYELDVVGDIRSTLDANINGLTVGKGGGSVASNTAVGLNSLRDNVTGSGNTAIGIGSLVLNTNSLSTAVGGNALASLTGSGQYSTAVGYNALTTSTSGVENSAFGMEALRLSTTGASNTGIGARAGNDITTGSGNTLLGRNAGRGITTGQYNTIIGAEVTGLSSSLSNTIILADGQGNQRLVMNSTLATIGTDASINGLRVGRGGGSISTNTAVGFEAINATATGAGNVAIGYRAGRAITSGVYNVLTGFDAGILLTTGSYNYAYGMYAGRNLTTGSNNVLIGYNTGQALTTQSANVYIGHSAGDASNAAGNVGVGYWALRNATTGTGNTTLGFRSGSGITTGGSNTVIGTDAGFAIATGSSNVLLGIYAGIALTSSTNTAIGAESLFSLTTGANNTAIGYISGRYITAGTGNITSGNSVYLGYDTRASADGNTNETVIGYQARGNGSNSVTLGNTSVTKTILQGNVLIGTTTDAGFRLDVNGTARVSGNFDVASSTILKYTTGTTTNDGTKLVTNNNGASFAVQNTNATGFSGIEYLNNTGTAAIFTGFNNNNNQEFRFNNVATSGYINFMIGGTTALHINNSRSIGIGTTSPNASALLDVSSTTKGFLPPRMTNAQMVAIATPAAGLVVYDTTNNKLNVYDGTNWVAVH